MRNDDATEPRLELAAERLRRDSMMDRNIAGRYDITSVIGSGGMGTVYLAKQRGLNRSVAVKVLRKDLRVDPETATRFHREAHTLSLLTHPNTVRVFDFGETEDGRLYIVMELLHGKLLTQAKFREEEDGVIRAVRVTRQILGALAEAHSKGVIHRDLKPDNIFLADVDGHTEPIVKVLDFGIAKIVAGDPHIDQLETQKGTVFGTPRYMSPEQAQGRQLDGRSDLYGVGVLLYEMLAGRAPFNDPDAVVVMAKHIREPAPPLAEIAPGLDLPPELDEVVMKSLAKVPGERFQFAEEFIDALDASVPEADLYSRRRRVASSAGAVAAGTTAAGAAAPLGTASLPVRKTSSVSAWRWAAIALGVLGAALALVWLLRPSASLPTAEPLPGASPVDSSEAAHPPTRVEPQELAPPAPAEAADIRTGNAETVELPAVEVRSDETESAPSTVRATSKPSRTRPRTRTKRTDRYERF